MCNIYPRCRENIVRLSVSMNELYSGVAEPWNNEEAGGSLIIAENIVNTDRDDFRRSLTRESTFKHK